MTDPLDIGRGLRDASVTLEDMHHVALCAAGDALAIGVIVLAIAFIIRLRRGPR